jgi:uncharacterized iron-regulated membrane protein
MKYHRVISTAVMFLLLATTVPAFAQKGDEDKGGDGQKAQPAQHEAQPQHAQQAKAQPQRTEQAKAQPQHAQQTKAQPQRAEQAKAQPQHAQQTKAQPQRAEQAKAQPQHAQQTQRPARQQAPAVANNRGGGQHGRISNANYSSHFGHEHSFHMGHPRMMGGYNRFEYGGYSFGYNQGWPVGWGYNDDLYVEYIDGAYFLCDLRFPGVQITLNMF